MTRVFIADINPEQRFALSLMMHDLQLEVVGEAADWTATLEGMPLARAELLLVDWDLLPSPPHGALDDLRRVCPVAISIVLISRLGARQQAAVSCGADTFISKAETADRVIGQFMEVAAGIRASAASI